MGCERRICLIGIQVVACFSLYTVVLSSINPAISQSTCSQLVACCMRVWGEIRFQPDAGNQHVWHTDAINCLARLQSLRHNVHNGQHDGLSRENVEYVVHLIDRISMECSDVAENSGSEAAKREFLSRLVCLWAELRSVMLEI